MSQHDDQMLRAILEMRDLLRLLAEPAIAERDKKLRDTLRGLAGSAASKNAKAVLLMDGTRTQVEITKACGINKGQLSGLVRKLREAGLLGGEAKQPLLTISIPGNFFEEGGGSA